MMFDIDKKITFANMKLLLKPDEVEKKTCTPLNVILSMLKYCSHHIDFT